MPTDRALSARESRVRRVLARDGQRLWKVRPGRYHWEFGPYAVIRNSTNSIGLRGMTIEDLETDLGL